MARRLVNLIMAGVCLLAFQAAPVALAEVRDAHIIISDLHMNLDVPYSWLDKHLDTVATFLEDVKKRDDVAEVTILGDFVDDWVMPPDTTPDATFESILTTERNQGVIDALNDLSPDIKLNYITGNHDLLLFEQANLDAMYEYLPDINITTMEPGWGSYELNDVVYAEHGHRYTIANSPDTWSWGDQDSQLPLGYFIARTVTKTDGAADATPYPDVLAEQYKKVLGLGFLPSQSGLEAFQLTSEDGGYSLSRTWWENLLLDTLNNIIKYFPGLVEDATKMLYADLAIVEGLGPESVYVMNGLNNFSEDPTSREVDHKYEDIISKWSVRQDVVDPATAIAGDMGYLNLAAEDMMADELGLSFTPKIVLFGHTHTMYFKQYSDGTIYANTGTWIDKKPCSYVEIGVNKDESQTTYDVELWQYADVDGTINPTSQGKGSVTVGN